MADICSTIAGVASLIDVALRGCSVLYESINHLKDAPELSLRLRRTVQSVESILRCLDSFVVDYRKQQISTGVPSLLPDALDHELTTIKAELDALLNLLPTSNSSSQLRRRLKWVLDRKQLAEIVRRLDGHQITLILALQSFAQRNDISVDAQLLRRLAQIERQHKDSVKDLRQDLHLVSTGLHAELDVVTQSCAEILPAQGHLDAGVKDLYHLVSAGQNAASEKLDAIVDSLSQIRAGRDYVLSSTVLAASTEDVLARVVRAELQRVIMPTVKQCFNSLRGDSETQLKEIRRKIDEMALQVGSKFADMKQETVDPPRNSLLSTSPEDRIGESPFSRKTYQVTIEFQPAQALIQLRGLTLSVTNIQDQRGYSQICPFISTFAVVPWTAKIMEFSTKNDIEGIRALFERQLAAPSDRNEWGMTPLMHAACAGSSRACRLLLNEGSDPLATDESLRNIERTIRILIDIGVDICAVDRRGTLLHFVMRMSRPTGLVDAHHVVTSATALLKHGVDPCALDCHGTSIFNIAEEFNDTAILWEALQQAGYDVDEVQTETKRRQWCFNNSDQAFAEATAVYRAQVAPPSGKGLVLRKSIRRDKFED
ncbi:MAG: hypothetical protein LQ345_001699 [Seirophora villosa]|nr:MAG: hypothetical protein LQ345_001699 [Seirophora villosa]